MVLKERIDNVNYVIKLKYVTKLMMCTAEKIK